MSYYFGEEYEKGQAFLEAQRDAFDTKRAILESERDVSKMQLGEVYEKGQAFLEAQHDVFDTKHPFQVGEYYLLEDDVHQTHIRQRDEIEEFFEQTTDEIDELLEQARKNQLHSGLQIPLLSHDDRRMIIYNRLMEGETYPRAEYHKLMQTILNENQQILLTTLLRYNIQERDELFIKGILEEYSKKDAPIQTPEESSTKKDDERFVKRILQEYSEMGKELDMETFFQDDIFLPEFPDIKGSQLYDLFLSEFPDINGSQLYDLFYIWKRLEVRDHIKKGYV